MSLEEGFIGWLNRSTKTSLENFEFAIKAWKSAEFHSQFKYEIIFKWFIENSDEIFEQDYSKELTFSNIETFLKLQCPPGLVDHLIKLEFIKVFRKNVKKLSDHDHKTTEILFLLTENEIFQDILKHDYREFCKLIGLMFNIYDNFLQSSNEFLPKIESEFFGKIMKYLKDFIKRLPEAGKIKFTEYFSKMTLKYLIEVYITLRSKDLNFFEDLLDIEKSLYVDYEETVLRMYNQWPIHVNLLNFECSLINLRGNNKFYETLLKTIFIEFIQYESQPDIYLIIFAYILELFRKYEITLKFEINDKKVLDFLNDQITGLVNSHYKDNFYEILYLLCSTIRLNPLILEQNILQILPKILIMQKTSYKEMCKFEEFISLVIGMFKKLSRSEKMVANLLKFLKEHLKNNVISKKLKRKLLDNNEIASKKLKTEIFESSFDDLNEQETVESNSNNYVKLLIEYLIEAKPFPKVVESTAFKRIAFAWPVTTVGNEFSKFISSLTAKPSLVVWKTIIHSLAEQIEKLRDSEMDENLQFLVDFNSALLYNYFCGTKLPDQMDKFSIEVEQNEKLTRNLLENFGKTILSLEYNERIINAFLTIAWIFGQFSLILLYYCPDGENFNKTISYSDIHSYLSENEWKLILDKINTSGQRESKLNINKIGLQKIKANALFEELDSIKLKDILSSSSQLNEELKAIALDPENKWLHNFMSKAEKMEILNDIINDIFQNSSVSLLENFIEDSEYFELITLKLYQKIASEGFEKNSTLNLIDFEELLLNYNEKLEKTITNMNKKNYKIIKKHNPDIIKKSLNLLTNIPLGYAKSEFKTLIFILQLALYKDLIVIKDEALINQAFEVFHDILHFGEQIEIFKYFELEKILAIIEPKKSQKFYEFLFGTLKKTDEYSKNTLDNLINLLKSESTLSDDNLKLTQIAIEVLSHPNNVKYFRNYLEQMIKIYSNYIQSYFYNENRIVEEQDKKVVEKTLQVFPIYLNTNLSKINKKDADIKITEEFRKMCKIYIGYSINLHDEYAIKLINAALNYRVHLHFDSDEIQFVMQKYWNELKFDIQNYTLGANNYNNFTFNERNIENVMTLIMAHKGNEDFRGMLIELEKELNEENIIYVCNILTQIAKCQLSVIKGGLLNEYFKRIMLQITFKLKKDQNLQFENIEIILKILISMKVICENPKIPMSPDHIDDILSLLMDINIKKFIISDINLSSFKTLHKIMTELCSILIKNRSAIILDRIPQYSHIFKDLLQSICWYKSDRQKDAILPQNEIEDLAELVQKLESLMHQMAARSLEMKKIAPYLLTFTINLMVGNKRPTTLHPKIKTHVEAICYDLVATCDHRVGPFILRCSNDATKHVYETLCKEYKKYHKFKGKV